MKSATFAGQTRNRADAEQVSLGVFDCDKGQPLAEIRAALFVEGYAALIVPSYSHGATTTIVAHSNGTNGKKRTRTEPQRILTARLSRSRCERSDSDMKDRAQSSSSILHALGIASFFPEKPWMRSDYPDATTADRAFKSGLRRVAKKLRLQIDTNCLDVPRLFEPRSRRKA